MRKTGAHHSPQPVCETACFRELGRQHDWYLFPEVEIVDSVGRTRSRALITGVGVQGPSASHY